jgi:hypothetical protein
VERKNRETHSPGPYVNFLLVDQNLQSCTGESDTSRKEEASHTTSTIAMSSKHNLFSSSTNKTSCKEKTKLGPSVRLCLKTKIRRKVEKWA